MTLNVTQCDGVFVRSRRLDAVDATARVYAPRERTDVVAATPSTRAGAVVPRRAYPLCSA